MEATVLSFFPKRGLLLVHRYSGEGRLVSEARLEGVRLLSLEAPARCSSGAGEAEVCVVEGPAEVETRGSIAVVRCLGSD